MPQLSKLGVFIFSTIFLFILFFDQGFAVGFSPWAQKSWSGGTSNAVHNVQWDASGSWTKYSSKSGVTVNSSGLTVESGGELVSSIFYLGNKRAINVAPDFSTSDSFEVYARGASSPSGVSSQSWIEAFKNVPNGNIEICTLTQYPYIQYKVSKSTGNPVSVKSIQFNNELYSISGVVTNSSDVGISGATVSYDYFGNKQTTTAPLLDLHPNPPASDPGSFAVTLDFIPNKKINITVFAAGYVSQTKSFNLPKNTCSGSEAKTKYTLEANSSTNIPESSGPVNLSEFRKIKLPAIFLAKNSKTTNFSNIVDHKKIRGFTIDIPGKNRIIFNEVLDLSDRETVDFLKNLDKYLKMNKPGKIDLDSKKLKFFNKKASLIMDGLKLVSTPEILVNGKKDTDKVVSNLSFKEGLATFDVAHFTSFEATPNLELASPTDGSTITQENPIIKGRISDPNSKVTGKFNEVNLAPITPDKVTGEFMIDNLLFKEGENFLTFEAESELGKVSPLVATIIYNPNEIEDSTIIGLEKRVFYTIVFGSVMIIGIISGYLIHRRRKMILNNKTKPLTTE